MTGSLYVLVYPEATPSETWDTVDDAAYGKAINRAAATCEERIALLTSDTYTQKEDTEYNGDAYQLAPGVSADDWDILEGDPELLDGLVEDIIDGLDEDTRILLGGSHRHDEIQRVATRLRTFGYTAVVDDRSTLPPRA